VWLTTESGTVTDVKAADIENLPSSHKVGRILQLFASDANLVQASPEISGGRCEAFLKKHGCLPWVLQYGNGDEHPGKMFQATTLVTFDQVRQVFLSFLAGSDEWRQQFTWVEARLPTFILTHLALGVLFSIPLAGVGAFLGECIGVFGWGADGLQPGAALGAGIPFLGWWTWVLLTLRGACQLKKPRPAELEHMQKVAAFIADMNRRGVSLGVAMPAPFFMGWRVRPPFFLSWVGNFLWLALLVGGLLAFPIGIVLLNYPPEFSALLLRIAAPVVVLVMVVVGACGATLYRREARRLQLPAWDSYLPPATAPVGGGTQEKVAT
jgi:hypothetical protein